MMCFVVCCGSLSNLFDQMTSAGDPRYSGHRYSEEITIALYTGCDPGSEHHTYSNHNRPGCPIAHFRGVTAY